MQPEAPSADQDPAAGTGPGEAVLAQAVTAYRRAFGSRLLAGYALGSLAHGGFSPLVSDVDLALLLSAPLRPADQWLVRRTAARVRSGGTPLHERLSVFWGTPATLRGQPGGRMPALDRLDLLDHGRLLTGGDVRAGVPRPGQSELLAASARFALGFLRGASGPADRLRRLVSGGRGPDASPVPEIRDPRLLASRGPRRLTKVVLFPVRFLFTARTGQAGPVTAAARAYLASPQPRAAGLVTAALAWRYQDPGAAAAGLLERELSPLYREFLDEYAVRLARSGADSQLADGLRQYAAALSP